MAKVIKEIDWNGHHYTFTNTFHSTSTRSHDILTMTDENGNSWTGETTWINRPWHRFDLEEAFSEIVSKAFGQKALDLVYEINKNAHSVEDAIETFFERFDPKDITLGSNETEAIDDSDEARKKALAEYLEVDEDEIELIDDNHEFQLSNGDCYIVLTNEEANDAFEDRIRQYWEDYGLDGVSDWMRDWILENAVDSDELEDFVREDIARWVIDMSDEEVVDECIDAGLVQSNEVYDENSDEDAPELRDDVDFDDLRDKLVEEKMSDVEDYAEYLRDSGFDDAFFMNYIDDEKVIESLIDDAEVNGEGRGGEIAYYDGQEHEVGNFYAYQVE